MRPILFFFSSFFLECAGFPRWVSFRREHPEQAQADRERRAAPAGVRAGEEAEGGGRCEEEHGGTTTTIIVLNLPAGEMDLGFNMGLSKVLLPYLS